MKRTENANGINHKMSETNRSFNLYCKKIKSVEKCENLIFTHYCQYLRNTEQFSYTISSKNPNDGRHESYWADNLKYY